MEKKVIFNLDEFDTVIESLRDFCKSTIFTDDEHKCAYLEVLCDLYEAYFSLGVYNRHFNE